MAQPPQDFITIKKMAIKMNAMNFLTNKEFLASVDIRKKIKQVEKKEFYLKFN